jgi:hypothetical protein
VGSNLLECGAEIDVPVNEILDVGNQLRF